MTSFRCGVLLRWFVAGLNGLLLMACSDPDSGISRTAPPHIVLIVAEDMGLRVGSFGDPVAHTPNIDKLAAQGVRYTRAFTSAGVCAPSRAALAMGTYQQSFGAMHMRTASASPFPYAAVPPVDMRAFPELLRAAGYYTSNNGKTDYQFGKPLSPWNQSHNATHWRDAPDGKPFFFMQTLFVSHESYSWIPDERAPADRHPQASRILQRNARSDESKIHFTDPAHVVVPPYYPDTPEVRASIARHYDNIALMDAEFGQIMAELEADGLLERTIIIWTTDHGDGLPRAKRSVYDSGLHVPLVIRFPDGYRAGEIEEGLLSFVDLGPSLLALAGVQTPEFMHGQPQLMPGHEGGRRHVFAASDRVGENPGRLRAVRNDRYKYIRNFRPDLPRLMPLRYRDEHPVMRALWQLREEGGLPISIEPFFDAPSPQEELYDTWSDPYEINNLADHQAFSHVRQGLSDELDRWLAEVPDLGLIPEEELAEQYWPGGMEPQTGPVTACQRRGGADIEIELRCVTHGAPILYQTTFVDERSWQLYTQALIVPENSPLTAVAMRYGYARSEALVVSSVSDLPSCD